MLKWINRWLRHSSHFHLRQGQLSSLSDLVSLLDRFLDDRLRYPLEWDDFVSWEHQVPAIESVRERISETEPLFFSGHPEDLAKGCAVVLEERNKAAALVGQPARSLEAMMLPD